MKSALFMSDLQCLSQCLQHMHQVSLRKGRLDVYFVFQCETNAFRKIIQIADHWSYVRSIFANGFPPDRRFRHIKIREDVEVFRIKIASEIFQGSIILGGQTDSKIRQPIKHHRARDCSVIFQRRDDLIVDYGIGYSIYQRRQNVR